VLIIVPLFIHPSVAAEAGTLRVAAIQGNAKAGLFANTRWGSILENHLRQTRELMKTQQGRSAQLVIWPENAADISPIDYLQAAAKITALVNEIDKPLILGTTRQHGKRVYNSSLLWLPKSGLAAVYDKKRPVPFAEYVPDRPFWHGIAPSLIDLIQRGFAPGHRSGIFKVDGATTGVLICFEIAIDEINHELVQQGAQVIISQTNNADFGHSAETYQQAQLAKLQAIASGRAVVNISTVGVSEVILPDGSVVTKAPVFQPASLIASIPLRTSMTPAQNLSIYLELAVNLFAASLCLLALLGLTRKN
jgi:apolipoprotein N-acyltransferase